MKSTMAKKRLTTMCYICYLLHYQTVSLFALYQSLCGKGIVSPFFCYVAIILESDNLCLCCMYAMLYAVL